MQELSRLLITLYLTFPIMASGQDWYDQVNDFAMLYSDVYLNFDDHHERYRILSQRKFDLNTVDINELAEIPRLTNDQAQAIIDYRNKYHHINRYSELTQIGSIDRYQIQIIKRYTYISRSKLDELGKSLPQMDHRLVSFDSNHDLGNGQTGQTNRQIQSLLLPSYISSDSLAFDAILSHRPINHLEYDTNSNTLKSTLSTHWREERVSLSDLSHSQGKSQSQWILGDYNIGFAQGLTINTGYRRHIDGLYKYTPFRVNPFFAKITQRPSLRGFGYQLKFENKIGQLNASLFASNQDVDERRYDGVINESLLGQQMSIKHGNHHIGIIHYNASTKLNLDTLDVSLPARSLYSGLDSIWSTGIYYEYRSTERFSTEINQSQNGGKAIQLSWNKDINFNSSISISSRWVNHRFANPHANPESIAEYLDIPERHDEQGLRILLNHKFAKLRSSTLIDYWRFTFVPDSNGEWYEDPNPPINAYLRQLFTITLTQPHNYQLQTLKFGADLADLDIHSNGRNYSFTGDINQARGQRRRVFIAYQQNSQHFNNRIEFIQKWQDVESNPWRFEKQSLMAVELAYKVRKNSVITIGKLKTFHPLVNDTSRHDNNSELLGQTHLGYWQQISQSLSADISWREVELQYYPSNQSNFEGFFNKVLLIQVRYSS